MAKKLNSQEQSEFDRFYNPKPQIVPKLPSPKDVRDFSEVYIKNSDNTYASHKMISGQWIKTGDGLSSTGPSGVILPPGGTTGQVLTKASNGNYNTGWGTVTSPTKASATDVETGTDDAKYVTSKALNNAGIDLSVAATLSLARNIYFTISRTIYGFGNILLRAGTGSALYLGANNQNGKVVINADGSVYLKPMVSTDASINSLFLDSADNILKFKDAGSVVHSLW